MSKNDLARIEKPIKKEFRLFSVEAFSAGKKGPALNEDLWVATADTLAVIDGSTIGNLNFNGESSGQFAASQVRNAILSVQSSLIGKNLVDFINQEISGQYKKLDIEKDLKGNPHPAAIFTSATITNSEIVITQVGDVNFRINEKDLYPNPIRYDEVIIRKRIKVLESTLKINPQITDDELLEIGDKAVKLLLDTQGRKYANNAASKYGYGEIDGRSVPEKFIKVYKFDLSNTRILEIFSDGYFKIPKVALIQSWEKCFREVEKIDPLKIDEYPSVKGSSRNHLTDDRTILIARFKS